MYNLPPYLVYHLPPTTALAVPGPLDLVEFRLFIEQDDNSITILKLSSSESMIDAQEHIYAKLWFTVKRLEAADLQMMYQRSDRCGYTAVQPDKIVGKYLQDRVLLAKSTQDSRPSLHVGFNYKGQSVGRAPPLDYSSTLDLARDLVGNNDIQLPEEIPLQIMHNQTRYTRSASFGSNDSCVDIKHFIIEHMLVQALEPSRKDLDDEDIVL